MPTFSSLTDHRSPLLAAGDLSTLATSMQRISLVTALGSDTAPGTEVSGGSYARAVSSWGAPTGSGYMWLSTAVSFASLPAGDVVGWEAWDATGANRYTYGLFMPTLCLARASTDSLSLSGFHGNPQGGYLEFNEGQKVVFHPNHCPAGLTPGAVYYVRDSDGRSFRVAQTANGPAVTLTADTPEATPCVVGKVLTAGAGDTLTAYSIGVRETDIGWSTHGRAWWPVTGYFNTGAPSIPPEPSQTWDPATMLGSDQIHPNDAGMTYLADVYQRALALVGKTPVAGANLYAYGDSWTASDSMNTPALRAIHQLRDRLGLTLTNQAVNSYMMGDVAARGIGTAGTLTAGTGSLVFITAGINDLYLADTTQRRNAITNYLRALVAVASAAERIEETATTKTGTWSQYSHQVFSGGENAGTTASGSTATYTVTTPGTYYLLTYGRNDNIASAVVTVAQGTTQLAQVDLTGLTAPTNGLLLPIGFGPVAIRLENVQAGALTVTVTNGGRPGAEGYVDALLRMSVTPPTVLIAKTVRVTYASLNKPALLASIRNSYSTVAAEFGPHVVVCDPDPSWTP